MSNKKLFYIALQQQNDSKQKQNYIMLNSDHVITNIKV